jgi:capping protein alpha
MADYEEEIPDEEKVKIASDFIASAPPGEFNEVFNDVRMLLDNDALLKGDVSAVFSQYNEEQFTPAKVDDASTVLITEFGRAADGRYSDPSGKRTFAFDHLRKEVKDIQDGDATANEDLRSAVDSAVADYVKEHYPAGFHTVYGGDDEVTVCIEDHKFQPQNFYNGRWRSQWKLSTGGKATGLLRVQVHYYEDGNVLLNSHKEVVDNVSKGAPADMAKALTAAMKAAEEEYQRAISENYSQMSDTTFKALRRQLPITRSKVQWTKILNYNIGKELKK